MRRRAAQYFDMHNKFFSEQRGLGAADLPKHAQTVRLDVGEFEECLAGGQKAGVTGTPTFFIGVTHPNGTIKVLNALKGAQPFAAFKDAIDSALAANP